MGMSCYKKDLQRKESQHFDPLDIVYEPNFDLQTPVFCYFCPEIHKAYKSYVEQKRNGKSYVSNITVRQCHYCNNCFGKTDEKMKHLFVRLKRA